MSTKSKVVTFDPPCKVKSVNTALIVSVLDCITTYCSLVSEGLGYEAKRTTTTTGRRVGGSGVPRTTCLGVSGQV